MARAKDNLPSHVTATLDSNNPTTFSFERMLGEGGEGAAAVYISSDGKRVTVKVQFCDDVDSQKHGEEEAALAAQAAAAIGDACTTEGCPGCTVKASAIREPLSTVQRGKCSFALYPYVQLNLAEWLANTPKRSPQVITSLFEQALGIVICLQDKGFYYTDLKPSNFLVIQDNAADLNPQLVVGDLGGIITKDGKAVQLPTGRLPPILLKDFDWKKMDQVTSFLLATLALELVLRAPSTTDPSAPLDAFFSCLQKNATTSTTAAPPECVEDVLGNLKNNIAPGLSLADPQVKALVASALNLMGYRNAYIRPAEIAGLLSQRSSKVGNSKR